MAIRLSALLLLCLPVFAVAADPLLEQPPLKLTVTIGGKEMTLEPGEEKKVEGEFKDPVVKVTTGDSRTFAKSGISFAYPASWNWEAEKTEFGYTWTIEGPDVTLIMSTFDQEVEGKTMLEENPFVDEETKIKEWSAQSGGRDFKGWQVKVAAAGETAAIYAFNIPVKKGSAVIQLIDSADEDKSSAEFRALLETLGKTLRSGGK